MWDVGGMDEWMNGRRKGEEEKGRKEERKIPQTKRNRRDGWTRASGRVCQGKEENILYIGMQ